MSGGASLRSTTPSRSRARCAKARSADVAPRRHARYHHKVDAIVDQLTRYFDAGRQGVVAVYLYGSVARGAARRDSDVDVGVLFAQAPSSTLVAQPYAMEDELSGLVGRAVQVVVLNAAPPDLVHRVLRDGILVAEHDRSARVRFEVKSRNEYFDVLPHLLEYRRPRAP